MKELCHVYGYCDITSVREIPTWKQEVCVGEPVDDSSNMCSSLSWCDNCSRIARANSSTWTRLTWTASQVLNHTLSTSSSRIFSKRLVFGFLAHLGQHLRDFFYHCSFFNMSHINTWAQPQFWCCWLLGRRVCLRPSANHSCIKFKVEYANYVKNDWGLEADQLTYHNLKQNSIPPREHLFAQPRQTSSVWSAIKLELDDCIVYVAKNTPTLISCRCENCSKVMPPRTSCQPTIRQAAVRCRQQ